MKKKLCILMMLVVALVGCAPAWATENGDDLDVVLNDVEHNNEFIDNTLEPVVPSLENGSTYTDLSGSLGAGKLPVVDISENSINAIADAVGYEGVQYEHQTVINLEQGQVLVIDTADPDFFENYDCCFIRSAMNGGYFLVWSRGGEIKICKEYGYTFYQYGDNVSNSSAWVRPVYKSGYGFLVSFADASEITQKSGFDAYGIEFATNHIVDYKTGEVLYTSQFAPPITYDVEFVTGVDDLKFDTQKVENAAQIVLPDLVDIPGYITATGWYLDEKCTLPIDITTYTITSDIKLYANYIAFPTVTFITSFYDLTIESQRLEDIRDFVYPEFNDPEGYKFVDWYVDAEMRDVFDPETYVITGDFSLYGKFEPVPVISFVTGFDDLTIENQYANKLNLPTPRYSGYTFVGWYTDENLTQLFNSSLEITEDITLYAKFKEAGRMELFVQGIFDSLTTLFEVDSIRYVLSICALVIVFGTLFTLMSSRR